MKRLLILPTLLLASTASAGIYANCAEAAKDGRYDIPKDSLYYRVELDRDKDGKACEKTGDDEIRPEYDPFYRPYNPFFTGDISTGSASAVQILYGPTSPVPPDPTAMKVYRVIQVVSGTRVILNAEYTDVTTELIGVQVPQGQAGQAKAWLADLLPVNTLVYVEQDKALPRGSALPVYIWVDRQLVNTQLILAGLAAAGGSIPSTKYSSYFGAAQASAQERALGIWGK